MTGCKLHVGVGPLGLICVTASADDQNMELSWICFFALQRLNGIIMYYFPQDDLQFEFGRQSWSGFVSGDVPITIPVVVRKRLSRRSLTPTQSTSTFNSVELAEHCPRIRSDPMAYLPRQPNLPGCLGMPPTDRVRNFSSRSVYLRSRAPPREAQIFRLRTVPCQAPTSTCF